MHAGGDRRQRQRRLAGEPAVDVHRRPRGIRFDDHEPAASADADALLPSQTR